jgi:hypothetical protein
MGKAQAQFNDKVDELQAALQQIDEMDDDDIVNLRQLKNPSDKTKEALLPVFLLHDNRINENLGWAGAAGKPGMQNLMWSSDFKHNFKRTKPERINKKLLEWVRNYMKTNSYNTFKYQDKNGKEIVKGINIFVSWVCAITAPGAKSGGGSSGGGVTTGKLSEAEMKKALAPFQKAIDDAQAALDEQKEKLAYIENLLVTLE